MQIHAGVAELVDALDLGSSDESCGGSSPSARTKRLSRLHGLLGPCSARIFFRSEPGSMNHRRRGVLPRAGSINDSVPTRVACRDRTRRRLDAMQVTETLSEGLKHEFKISVPASDLDAKAGAKLVDLKDKVRLNGFRPGKVPVTHLKKVYGRSVMAETIDQTIRDTNTQLFSERGFKLATEPKITMPTEQAE